MEMSLLFNLIELIYSPKCKSNFYMTIASLLLIHFWILSTYLIGYLATSASSSPASPSYTTTTVSTSGSPQSNAALNAIIQDDLLVSTATSSSSLAHYDLSMAVLNHHHALWNFVEVLVSFVGGVGMAVFFKNMFLIIFESSHLVHAGAFDSAQAVSLDDDELRSIGNKAATAVHARNEQSQKSTFNVHSSN